MANTWIEINSSIGAVSGGGGGGGSGTVTSVDMSVPGALTISGNPITTSGILALSYSSTGTAYLTNSEFDIGNSGAAFTANFTAANGFAQKVNLNQGTTATLQNIGPGGSYVLRVATTGAGNFNISWPASVKWGTVGPPTISASSGKSDLINFYGTADGSILGSYSQGY
jgi:hypothetical protein